MNTCTVYSLARALGKYRSLRLEVYNLSPDGRPGAISRQRLLKLQPDGTVHCHYQWWDTYRRAYDHKHKFRSCYVDVKWQRSVETFTRMFRHDSLGKYVITKVSTRNRVLWRYAPV